LLAGRELDFKMKAEKFNSSEPKEVKRMLAKKAKKEKDIIMTAFHAYGIQDIKDVVEEISKDVTKAFHYNGKVFLIVGCTFGGGYITFNVQSTKEVLIALKLKKLIS
jgi:uncharacterized hydantoinase/oxoprolinase family protein